MALVNAFSSLSLAAPKAAGLGFKKAVAAFAQPAARVSGARVAFAVEAKQNKKARVIQVRSAATAGARRARTDAASAYSHRHARERAGSALGSRPCWSRRAKRAGSPGGVPKPSCGFFERVSISFSERRGASSVAPPHERRPEPLIANRPRLTCRFPIITHSDRPNHRQSRNERLKNKMRKSEITTRMKKVFLKAEALKAASACSDADVGELEALISQATKAVDKAVGKGVLHKNTGARRKSRMSKYKQELRRDKGLLTA